MFLKPTNRTEASLNMLWNQENPDARSRNPCSNQDVDGTRERFTRKVNKYNTSSLFAFLTVYFSSND